MELLDQHINSKKEILKYFGVNENDSANILDYRNLYWSAGSKYRIDCSESLKDLRRGKFSHSPYLWESKLFRTSDFTLAFLERSEGDTYYFGIFNNSKEIKE
jgi:hypothetical protein